MNTVQQIARFQRAHVNLQFVQDERMKQHMEKGGWEAMPLKELTLPAYQKLNWLHNNIPNTADEGMCDQYIEMIADAANYLVMLYDRVRDGVTV